MWRKSKVCVVRCVSGRREDRKTGRQEDRKTRGRGDAGTGGQEDRRIGRRGDAGTRGREDRRTRRQEDRRIGEQEDRTTENWICPFAVHSPSIPSIPSTASTASTWSTMSIWSTGCNGRGQARGPAPTPLDRAGTGACPYGKPPATSSKPSAASRINDARSTARR